MEVTDSDLLGYAAAVLVLATFCMRSMSALRWVAIASNLTLIAYACSARLAPVLLLHALLLPINVIRLFQQSGGVSRSSRTRAPKSPEGVVLGRSGRLTASDVGP